MIKQSDWLKTCSLKHVLIGLIFLQSKSELPRQERNSAFTSKIITIIIIIISSSSSSSIVLLLQEV
jgi:uncharacterized membrane protein SirB2